MNTNELTKKIRNYRELQRLIEEAQAEMDGIKIEVQAEMTAQGTDTLLAGEYKVSWTPYSTSRFDAKALKAVNPELYSMFARTTETRRFSVS